MLITGKSDEEVLSRLMKAGLRIKREKCIFMTDSVTYLGYKIDAEGIHPTSEKVEAIEKAPSPTNVSQLKSYLGLLAYYGIGAVLAHKFPDGSEKPVGYVSRTLTDFEKNYSQM